MSNDPYDNDKTDRSLKFSRQQVFEAMKRPLVQK